jgi:hypothetical protein
MQKLMSEKVERPDILGGFGDDAITRPLGLEEASRLDEYVEHQQRIIDRLYFDLGMEKNSKEEWLLAGDAATIITSAGYMSPYERGRLCAILDAMLTRIERGDVTNATAICRDALDLARPERIYP